MHEFPWFWVLFGTLVWLVMLRPRRAWACRGGALSDGMREGFAEARRRPRRADLEQALAERDACIAKLEERVRVLERIVTDDAARLRAEIDSLGDPPARV